jgi:hypothetical protein
VPVLLLVLCAAAAAAAVQGAGCVPLLLPLLLPARAHLVMLLAQGDCHCTNAKR